MKPEPDVLWLALDVSLAFPARLVIKYWAVGFNVYPKGRNTAMDRRLDM